MSEEQVVCPCCGGRLDMTIPASLLALPFTDAQRRVLEVFVNAFPGPVINERIMSKLWGGDPDGGPMYAENIVAVHLHRIRQLIRPHGFDVARAGFKTRVLRRVSPTIHTPTKSVGGSLRNSSFSFGSRAKSGHNGGHVNA